MRAPTQYATQSVLAAMQSTVIIGGSLATAAMMKLSGYPDPSLRWPPSVHFVREWGFLLIAIPAFWVCWSISLERARQSAFSKRWTLVTGVALLGVLFGFFCFSAAAGARVGQVITVHKSKS